MWFAFKLISLSYWIQLSLHRSAFRSRCDLLSNLYLCHIEYSIKNGLMYCILLWFAFKLISLSYWIQLISYRPVRKDCCDLLSNLYLCHIEYSPISEITKVTTVVICFQTYIFVILNTAPFDLIHVQILLWFAFKLISLSYWIQRYGLLSYLRTVVICFQTYIFVILNTAILAGDAIDLGCDLLSNLYLCHIEYSRKTT